MDINALKVVKRSDSKKKLSFEITKADLEQDMIEFKGSPHRKAGNRYIKSSDTKNADKWFKNKAKKDQNFRVTITYKKNSLMQATIVNIYDVKNLKIDENAESNTPTYKIKGEFVHKNDSVFSDIHDVRLIFTSKPPQPISQHHRSLKWDSSRANTMIVICTVPPLAKLCKLLYTFIISSYFGEFET